MSNEKELEKERFASLIRYFRNNTASKNRILKKWERTKGIDYVKMIRIEINSNRHLK